MIKSLIIFFFSLQSMNLNVFTCIYQRSIVLIFIFSYCINIIRTVIYILVVIVYFLCVAFIFTAFLVQFLCQKILQRNYIGTIKCLFLYNFWDLHLVQKEFLNNKIMNTTFLHFSCRFQSVPLRMFCNLLTFNLLLNICWIFINFLYTLENVMQSLISGTRV